MLIKHQGKSPRVHPSAYVAPNAAVCGDVLIGPGCRILFGAQIIAEGGSISIGTECIVMENAVVTRSRLATTASSGLTPTLLAALLKTKSSLPRGPRSSTVLGSEKVARFGSMESCTSRRTSCPAIQFRLVGSL